MSSTAVFFLLAISNLLKTPGRQAPCGAGFQKTWQFVALRAYNLKKSPIRRFFTLQTANAAHILMIFCGIKRKKSTSATGC
jgi:hypothetical protein